MICHIFFLLNWCGGIHVVFFQKGKTTVTYYDDPDITFANANKRDMANACIFPAQAPADLYDLGAEVVMAVKRVPAGHRHHVFQVAMDMLETCW